MKKIVSLLLISLILACGSSKNKRVVTTKKQRTTKVTTKPKSTSTSKSTSISNSSLAEKVIKNAEAYQGVKYKYGGTTSKGMDCSGLIQTAFTQENIQMPRTTSILVSHGDWIDIKNIQKGDLVFFATNKNSRKVSHVGLVTSARIGRIEFIHASSSKGVMTSLLSERYWYQAYVQARRVL